MSTTMKNDALQSPEKNEKASTRPQAPSWLTRERPTPQKYYTVEEQWEIAKKLGAVIMPSLGVPRQKMQSGQETEQENAEQTRDGDLTAKEIKAFKD